MNTLQKVKVLGIRNLTESTYVLRTTRNNFEFVPGQCVNIGLVGGAVNREYSTYSSVNQKKYLEFLIKKVDGGLVSVGVSTLKPGNEVTLDGAYGRFVIEKPNSTQKYIFIASGTGIAPFHSYVKSYPGVDYQVLHGIRTASEQYDRKDYENNRYISCISGGVGGDFSGRVTDYLKSVILSKNAIYYLCGNHGMINDVYDILRTSKVNGSNIFTEVFF